MPNLTVSNDIDTLLQSADFAEASGLLLASPGPIGGTTPAAVSGTVGTFTDATAPLIAQAVAGANMERVRISFPGNVCILYEVSGSGTNRNMAIGTTTGAGLQIVCNNTARWAFDSSGNLSGMDAAHDISAVGNIYDIRGYLELNEIASLGSPASGRARIGVKDVAGTAEVFVKDEAGNETQISPHNHTAPASFVDAAFDEVGFSANVYTGVVVYTNRQRQRAGRPDFQFVETFAQHNARLGLTGAVALVQLDWATVQQGHVTAAQARHDAWAARKTAWEANAANGGKPFTEEEPALYVAKPVPSWLTAQLSGRDAYVAANAAIHAATAGLVTKRSSLKTQIATLRSWATDATNAAANWGTRTQAQKDAIHVQTFTRLASLLNGFSDLLETQGIGD